MEEKDYFIVIEIQSGDSVAVVPPSIYTSWNDALSKFYQTMISAVQSSFSEHTVLIMDKLGQVVKKETMYHEVEK